MARANLEFNLSYEADTVANVPEELEPLAQSVLAEAVRNVRKHADPTLVEVRTARVDGAFVLEVINDGVAPGAAHQPGMGLRLAAFEALQSGGIVEFGPLDAGSWHVRLVVPHEPSTGTQDGTRVGAGWRLGSGRCLSPQPRRRPAAPSACGCSSSTTTTWSTGASG